MATYNQFPINKSFLSNNKYEFVIERLPHVTFFVQSIVIPDVTLSGTLVSTPFVNLPIPNNTLQYTELQLTFIMDEEMKSWREIYEWMYNLGNPESKNKIGNLTQIPGRRNSITSDASLLIKSNANNPRIKFIFYDMFPNSLSGVTLSSTEGQEFLTSTISFLYSHYNVTSI
jgi:hypothetical protein